MSWGRLYASAPDHPKFWELGELLSLSETHAFGHVVRLWCFCFEAAPDGNLGDKSPRWVARIARWEGDPERFVSALIEVNLAERGDDGELIVHNLRNQGHHLAEKQRRYREKRREEKKRKEKKRERGNQRVTNATVTRYQQPLEMVLSAYLKHHPRATPGDKEKDAIRKLLKQGIDAERIVEAIEGQHRSEWHTGKNPKTGGKKYLDLWRVVKDSAAVNHFADSYPAPGERGGLASEQETLRLIGGGE